MEKLIKTIFGPEYHEDRVDPITLRFLQGNSCPRQDICGLFGGVGRNIMGSDIVEMTLGGDFFRGLCIQICRSSVSGPLS